MINENNYKDITCKKCNTSFDAPEKIIVLYVEKLVALRKMLQ